MDSPLDSQAADLFMALLDVEVAGRGAFLDDACGIGTPLRARVDALLRADGAAGNFLEDGSPLRSVDAAEPARAMIAQRVGRYTIDRLIGCGGMGTVYEATQESPRRTVALKLMRAGVISAPTLKRFEYETQILGRLRHPGIVQIHEAGVWRRDGDASIPYFAMEYIPEARSILEYAAEHGLDARQRLEHFLEVCAAVHHGHQRGVIHRDLKPSNILVGTEGPGDQGTNVLKEKGWHNASLGPSAPRSLVKIIDFGVARAINSDIAATTMHSGVGQIIGTLRYMSPEQCDADPLAIDVRSDVYTLGVVLYELLTGQLPYDVDTGPAARALHVIRETPPRRLSTALNGWSASNGPSAWHGPLARELRGDIETIVMRCLAKERERRYQSVDDLARDIRHYLSNEPIEARRDSALYVFRKFIRRHRAISASAAAILMLIVGSSVVSWTLMLRAKSAEIRATSAEGRAVAKAESEKRISEFYSNLLLNMDPWSEGAVRAGTKPEDIRLPDLLREAVKRIPAIFKDRPDLGARLQCNVGRAFNGLSLPDEAEKIFRESYDAARTVLGEDAPATLELQRNLGWSLWNRFKLDEAVQIFRHVADRTARVFGEDSPESLRSLMSLSIPLCQTHRFDEGQRVADRVMTIVERTLREDDPIFTEALSQHATVLRLSGKTAEAERFARRAVDQARRIANGRSIYLAVALERLAPLVQPVEMLSVLQENLEIHRSIQGENHIDTVRAARQYCDALVRNRHCDEALSLAQKIADACDTLFGFMHSESVLSYTQLAQFLIGCQRISEAESLLRERLALATGGASQEIRYRREIGLSLAAALDAQGKAAEAEAAATGALRQAIPIGFSDGVAYTQKNLYPLVGHCMIRLGLNQEAEWRLLDTHRRFATQCPEGNTTDQQAVADLVSLYDAWGKPDKAAEFRALLPVGPH